MMPFTSPLEKERVGLIPEFPPCFSSMRLLSFQEKPYVEPISAEIASLFPHLTALRLMEGVEKQEEATLCKPLKVGVVFSGGQAPGGHNVIAGIVDGLEKRGERGEVVGFLNGPSGIVSGFYKSLSQEEVSSFLNTGGFDLLGSGRTKIETKEQLESAFAVCTQLDLDTLVIIGGDDSNTNAALLSEFFLQRGGKTCVVGIPKTIDGDLKNAFVSAPFGFDTASKVYSELIGNLARDALSAKKYYHFVRLMGRTASHITLECSLATHPNYTFIAEEVFAQKKSLDAIVSELCYLIIERAKKGRSYGIILLPEGLIEWIPEISSLIEELNTILSLDEAISQENVMKKLTPSSLKCFSSMPFTIQTQLLYTRDPHGNVQVSLIETERMLAEMVVEKLKIMGKYKETNFQWLPHFFGYEGRSAFPSDFDASYCYSLGHVAALAASERLSGYMCFVSNLHKPISCWGFGAVPLIFLMHQEIRNGEKKPVIAKSLVDLEGKPFQEFKSTRNSWGIEDSYVFPGPMQLAKKIRPPYSLLLESSEST